MIAAVDRRAGEGGFTLMETLVALALMGLLLSALASITAQWLPNWNRGLDRIQRSELIGIALQRIGDDLAAAQTVPATGGDKPLPLFAGSERSITFVRTSVGPNAGPGLDVVHLGETTDREGLATVRSRTRFHPLPPGASLADQLHFTEPVVLLRAPYRLLFAYSGEDQVWKSSWPESEKLPAKIRLTVRDAGAHELSTVTTIHVQSSAQGDCKQAAGQCDDSAAGQNNPQGNPQQTASGGSQPAGGVAQAQGGSQ
jgi:general secretion pathway protein J